MKVIITNRFKKEYYKKFKKYFSKEEFAKSLREKQHTFIDLHFPFFKVKQKINMVEFRSIVYIVQEDKIIPIIISLKKDKMFGENINWRKNQILIKEEYKFSLIDLENGDFEVLKDL